MTRAIVEARMSGVASATGHFVKLSVASTMYLLPRFVVVRGPMQSIFHLSKAPTVGRGQRGAPCFSFAPFFWEQCLQDLTHEAMSSSWPFQKYLMRATALVRAMP